MLLLRTILIIFECSVEFNFLPFSLILSAYHTVIELGENYGKVTYTERTLDIFLNSISNKNKNQIDCTIPVFLYLFAFSKFTVYVFGGHFSFALVESRTIHRKPLLRDKNIQIQSH